jgi:hypothetical protein
MLRTDLSDLIALSEIYLQRSGLAKLQRAYCDGVPTEKRRWQVTEPDRLKQLIGVAIETADGAQELQRIKAIAAASENPFYTIRHCMSPRALQEFTSKLKTLATVTNSL